MNAEKLLKLYQAVKFQDAIDLSNTNLSEINFSNPKFITANFKGSKLENSNFY